MDNRTWSYVRGWKDARDGVQPRPEDYPEPGDYMTGYASSVEEKRLREPA